MINSILKYLIFFVKGKMWLLSGLIVFLPALFSPFMGDDEGQIINNVYIRSLRNIPLFFQGGTFYIGGVTDRLLSEYYRPMMVLVYSLIYSVFGQNAFFFHLVQLLLHMANAFLVYTLFKRLLRENSTSLLLATIFLVHPMSVETVVSIPNLQDILFFFFGMCAFYLLTLKWPQTMFIPAIFFLLLLSLLSKEVGITFFIVSFVFIDLFRLKKTGVYIAGSILVCLFYIILRCGIAHICTLGGKGSVVPIARMSLLERMLQAPSEVLYYIKTFFFPDNLAMFQYWISDMNLYGFYLPLVIVILFFILLFSFPFIIYFKRNRLPASFLGMWFEGRTSLAKVYAFFFIWLLVGLVLHIHILPLDSTVAGRWFYFPMVGLLGVIGIATLLFNRRKIIYTVFVIVIILLSIRSFMRAMQWMDPFILYGQDITVSKQSSSLENNYGSLLLKRHRYDEAERHFRNAIKLAPHSPIYWSNLAQVYEGRGDLKQAEKYYLKSIENGKFYVAFERYVDLLLRQKREKDAKKFLEKKALKTFPYNTTLHRIYTNLK